MPYKANMRQSSDAVFDMLPEDLIDLIRKVSKTTIISTPYFYSVKETSRALCCGKTKIFELLKTNQLEKVKMGSRTLITKSSVDALIAKLMQKGGSSGSSSAL